jgi:predicted RNA-binding protein with TRAM domain
MNLGTRTLRGTTVVLAGIFMFGGGTAYAASRPTPATPPTTPTDLRATSVTYNAIALSWGASSDRGASITYTLVITNPQIDAETTGRIPDITGTSLDWAGLVEPGETYTFTVFAVNSKGQGSADSNSVTVTTPAAPVPAAPTVSVTGVTPSTIELSYSDTTTNEELGFIIDLDGSVVPSSQLISGVDSGHPGQATIIGLSPGTTYRISIEADNAYQEVSPATTVSATTTVTTDTTPPTAPSELTLTDYEQALGYGCNDQVLTWAPSTDVNFPQSELFYEVLVNGVNQTEDDISGSEFPSGPISEEVFLPVGTNEVVSVLAVDPNGLSSTGNPTFTGTFVADC